MFDPHVWCGKIAAIVSIGGYLPLLIAIFRHQARPNRASWLIWSVVNTLTLLTYRASGATTTALVPLCYAILTPIVALLAFVYYGEGGWNPFDRLCLIVAALSGFVWWKFKAPGVAMLMNIAIVFVGALPTMRKAYRQPQSENKLAWLLFFLGCVWNILAIKNWQFFIMIYPILNTIANGIIISLLCWPRRKVGQLLPQGGNP